MHQVQISRCTPDLFLYNVLHNLHESEELAFSIYNTTSDLCGQTCTDIDRSFFFLGKDYRLGYRTVATLLQLPRSQGARYSILSRLS